MECLIGIQCKDFVLVAADMTTTQSIIVMKSGKIFITCLYAISNQLDIVLSLLICFTLDISVSFIIIIVTIQ